jgi:hypothetical protein
MSQLDTHATVLGDQRCLRLERFNNLVASNRHPAASSALTTKSLSSTYAPRPSKFRGVRHGIRGAVSEEKHLFAIGRILALAYPAR